MTESQVVNRWIAQAEIRMLRSLLVRTLTTRFGSPVPPEVQRVIDEPPSLPMLQSWFDQALTAASLDDFLAVLRR